MQIGSPSHVDSQDVSQAEALDVVPASVGALAVVASPAAAAAAARVAAVAGVQQTVPFTVQLMFTLMTERHSGPGPRQLPPAAAHSPLVPPSPAPASSLTLGARHDVRRRTATGSQRIPSS
jgi:hypothetical protein